MKKTILTSLFLSLFLTFATFTSIAGAQNVIVTSEAKKPLMQAVAVKSLIQAVKDNKFVEIQRLIANGADINAKDEKGQTALIMASSFRNNKIMVEYLVDKGADVNKKDKHGNTALMVASFNGDTAVAGYLVGKEALVNTKNNNGWTALTWAKKRGDDKKMANYLISLGAVE